MNASCSFARGSVNRVVNICLFASTNLYVSFRIVSKHFLFKITWVESQTCRSIVFDLAVSKSLWNQPKLHLYDILDNGSDISIPRYAEALAKK